jgi:outer membrane immunogenic protein
MCGLSATAFEIPQTRIGSGGGAVYAFGSRHGLDSGGWDLNKLFLAGIAGVAAAALYSAPAAAIAPSYNWTGCYIGVNAGGMWGKADADFASTNPNGFAGGGQLGCDYQSMSNWVVGLQGDFNWTRAHDSQNYDIPPIGGGMFETRMDWFASATARLGYAAGPWLIYGKGGAAWVRDRLMDSGSILIVSFDFSGNVTRSGWTAGGGFEYAFAPNWSAFVEYDFYDFGTKDVTIPGIGGLPPGPSSETISFKQNFSVVKAGINFRFSTGP